MAKPHLGLSLPPLAQLCGHREDTATSRAYENSLCHQLEEAHLLGCPQPWNRMCLVIKCGPWSHCKQFFLLRQTSTDGVLSLWDLIFDGAWKACLSKVCWRQTSVTPFSLSINWDGEIKSVLRCNTPLWPHALSLFMHLLSDRICTDYLFCTRHWARCYENSREYDTVILKIAAKSSKSPICGEVRLFWLNNTH